MKSNKVFRIIWKILRILAGLSIAAMVVLSIWWNIDFNNALKPVTDIAQYPTILHKSWQDSPLVQHFPQTIPAVAKNVKIYYQPGFLQGGSTLQLQMTLPPAKIAEIQTQLRQVAQRRYIPGAKDNSPTEETSADGQISVSFQYKFYLGQPGDQNFPQSYEILVLSDTRGAPSYDWNHGEMHGVAINIATSEIVYWAESW
jgi:hypothetical protein